MKVLWPPEAQAALLAMVVARNSFSEGSGDRLADRIRMRVDALETYPRLGRVMPEYGVPALRELIEGDHRIIYEVFPDRVEIVTIRHGAESLSTD